MVLLDSEGTDAVEGKGSDDHCIFTLTILLASMLVFNSAGVPSRKDCDDLGYPFDRFLFYFIHRLYLLYILYRLFVHFDYNGARVPPKRPENMRIKW